MCQQLQILALAGLQQVAQAEAAMSSDDKVLSRLRVQVMLGVGIGLGVLYWILESTVAAIVLGEDGSPRYLLPPHPDALLKRSVCAFLFATFSIGAYFAMFEHRRTRDAAQTRRPLGLNSPQDVAKPE